MESFAGINYYAVFVSALAVNILGGLWYSPVLFGKIWLKLAGLTPEKMASEKARGMIHRYFISLIASFVMAYVLAPFVAVGARGSLAPALLLGFWLWLGFIVTRFVGPSLWEGKSWGLYFLNISYELVAILLMATILVLWR